MPASRTFLRRSLVALWFISWNGFAAAAEPQPVTGAGEHFTWVLLDEIRPQLERDHNLKLNLIGRESMLGYGCNQGIKKAKEIRPGNNPFGFICCPLAREEVEKEGLTVHPVALEPLLIVVNRSNPVTDISLEQVRAIFRGEIRNWKDVGGED